MIVLIGPSGTNITVSDDHAVAVLSPEGPVGRVLKQEVLDHHILGAKNVKDSGAILLVLQEIDGAPPLLTISVDCT